MKEPLMVHREVGTKTKCGLDAWNVVVNNPKADLPACVTCPGCK